MFELGHAARLDAIDRRLAKIERQMKLLLDALDVVDERPRSAVVEALERGRKIDAIKAYRAETGAGLTDAKRAIEDIERELGA
jgi:ribosomal protein L7/L12